MAVTDAAAEAAAVLRLAERFPELRRDCDAGIIEIRPGGRSIDTTMVHWVGCPGRGCSECHGLGWLPVSPAEALYWLMGREDVWLCGPKFDGTWYAQWTDEQTHTGATALLALAAAV